MPEVFSQGSIGNQTHAHCGVNLEKRGWTGVALSEVQWQEKVQRVPKRAQLEEKDGLVI